MGNKEKLIERIESKRRKKDIKYSEVKKYLSYYDFIADRQSGSHVIFKNEELGLFVLVAAHNAHSIIAEWYIKDIVQMIKENF